MEKNNTNNTVEEIKEVQDEKEIIIDKALDEAWERGFKYGVAWVIKQTETDTLENEKQIDAILNKLEQFEMTKGITSIYCSLED